MVISVASRCPEMQIGDAQGREARGNKVLKLRQRGSPVRQGDLAGAEFDRQG